MRINRQSINNQRKITRDPNAIISTRRLTSRFNFTFLCRLQLLCRSLATFFKLELSASMQLLNGCHNGAAVKIGT